MEFGADAGHLLLVRGGWLFSYSWPRAHRRRERTSDCAHEQAVRGEAPSVQPTKLQRNSKLRNQIRRPKSEIRKKSETRRPNSCGGLRRRWKNRLWLECSRSREGC